MKHLANVWKKPRESLGSLWKKKLMDYRRDPVITKIDKPTRIDRARRLGYKAKQGYVVVRVRVGKGTRKRPKPAGGRRPKAAGRYYPPGKSLQSIAEQKASRKYPNLIPTSICGSVEDVTVLWDWRDRNSQATTSKQTTTMPVSHKLPHLSAYRRKIAVWLDSVTVGHYNYSREYKSLGMFRVRSRSPDALS